MTYLGNSNTAVQCGLKTPRRSRTRANRTMTLRRRFAGVQCRSGKRMHPPLAMTCEPPWIWPRHGETTCVFQTDAEEAAARLSQPLIDAFGKLRSGRFVDQQADWCCRPVVCQRPDGTVCGDDRACLIAGDHHGRIGGLPETAYRPAPASAKIEYHGLDGHWQGNSPIFVGRKLGSCEGDSPIFVGRKLGQPPSCSKNLVKPLDHRRTTSREIVPRTDAWHDTQPIGHLLRHLRKASAARQQITESARVIDVELQGHIAASWVGIDQQRLAPLARQRQLDCDGRRAHASLAARHHDPKRPRSPTRCFGPGSLEHPVSEVIGLVGHGLVVSGRWPVGQ